MERLKAGIIGYGYMGNYHHKKTDEVGTFEIKSVYDISDVAKDNAKKENLIVCNTVDEILQDNEIELVFICTPNDVHAYYSEMCLNAGKNVMVEKPVTMNEEELISVIECANKNDKIFTVHQNRRWDEDYISIKEMVESDKIGNITQIQSNVFGQKGVCYGWRADPVKGGGMLYDWGIHLIDQALQLFKGEKVTSVFARLKSIVTPAVDDSVEIELTFESELVYKINIATFCLQHQPRWLVLGDRGTMVLNEFNAKNGDVKKIKGSVEGFDSVFHKKNIGPSRTMAPLHPENIEEVELPIVEPNPTQYHRNLIEAIKGNEKIYVTYEDMLRAMKVVMASFESSQNNQVIKTEI